MDKRALMQSMQEPERFAKVTYQSFTFISVINAVFAVNFAVANVLIFTLVKALALITFHCCILTIIDDFAARFAAFAEVKYMVFLLRVVCGRAPVFFGATILLSGEVARLLGILRVE